MLQWADFTKFVKFGDRDHQAGKQEGLTGHRHTQESDDLTQVTVTRVKVTDHRSLIAVMRMSNR